jgi:2-dehydropantoate 2-reductase
MKFVIVGAGAIGGWIGAILAAHGHEVTALARGEQLAALQEHGWRCQIGAEVFGGPALAASSLSDVGTQDVVIIALKGTSLSPYASEIARLCHPETIVIPAINGVPWWFLNSLNGQAHQPPLQSVDPHGDLARELPLSRIIGSVVHATVTTPMAGVSRVGSAKAFILGEPSGVLTDRLRRLSDIFQDAGLPVVQTPEIQTEVWKKITANMIFNPLSALTRAETHPLVEDLLLRPFIDNLAHESEAIAAHLGVPSVDTAEQVIAAAKRLGSFKTSMLQDLERGRPLEIDSLLTAPREIGMRLGVSTPAMDTLQGLISQLERSRQVR